MSTQETSVHGGFGKLWYTLNVENGAPVIHTYRTLDALDGDNSHGASGECPYVQEVISICDFDRQSTKPFQIGNVFDFKNMMLDLRTLNLALATWSGEPLQPRTRSIQHSAPQDSMGIAGSSRDVNNSEQFAEAIRNRDVDTVYLNFIPTIAQFAELQNAVQIQRVTCIAVTDSHIQQLHKHPTLTGLNLYGSRITNACAPVIAGIRTLKELNVSRTAISDRFWEEFPHIGEFSSLSLAETKISGDFSFNIARENAVRSIDLSGTPVGDKFFTAEHTDWTGLHTARLAQTGVTDTTMEFMARCPNLGRLDLRFCNVTWQGLKALIGHETLSTLLLRGTPINLSEYEVLREGLPRCAIEL